MLTIFIVILPLFIIIFLGVVLQKTKVANDKWLSSLNDYALYIGLPALIFSSISKTPFIFSEQKELILINSLFLIVSFLIAFIIGRIIKLGPENMRTLFISLAFSNVAFLGIPILTQIYTTSILSTTSIIVAIYIFWIFTIGVGFLEYSTEKEKKGLIKKIFINLIKNPLLLVVIIGITLSSLNISLPELVTHSIDMIALSATPIVLIVIGLFIGQSKPGNLSEWFPVFLFSLSTLFFLPAGLYLGILYFGFSPLFFSSSIIQAGMPLAITTFALADKYKLNKNFIARAIVLSTALSVLSIPFWASFLL